MNTQTNYPELNGALKIEYQERSCKGIPCPLCEGYADRLTRATEEEDAEVGCGRQFCCSAAFVCRKCGKRMFSSLESPDMDNF